MTELERLSAALDEASSGGGAPVLVTLLSVSGSAYRGPGARMVVHPDGSSAGAISGGCLEKDVIAHAEQVRAAGRPRVVTYDLTRDDDAPWGLGMGCNAALGVLLEPCPGGAPAWLDQVRQRHARREPAVIVAGEGGSRLAAGEAPALEAAREAASRFRDGLLYDYLPPPLALFVAGDGPDVAPLARLADSLGWSTCLVGKDDAVPQPDQRTAAVILTHNYARDLELLGRWLPSRARYVGLLGPRSRTERLLSDLADRGVRPTPRELSRLHAPVGLDIGAESPDEIAVAILAEVRAAFSGRPGTPLRDRRGPIHDRG